MSKIRKDLKDIVYSTNPNFQYSFEDENEESETLAPEKQDLRVMVDRKHRNGKTVTIISGFIGKSDDMEELAKTIKKHCGTGGSVVDGVIVIQGEMPDKIMKILTDKKYKCKRAGG